MDYVTRIHLKTGKTDVRESLINFCLKGERQYIAIGWSYVYKDNPDISNYEEYYYAVKKSVNRINPVHNVFWYAKENDLFWTRDLEGCYWICRVKNTAEILCKEELDIGAVLPVEAYKYGLEVPGQIKASFNRPRGGTSERIDNKIIIEFSKDIYNELSGTSIYSVEKVDGNLLDNLPDFELEELVISYIQLKENYYLLSNSIANKSTTIKIECEFIHRNKNDAKKAVAQVKGGNSRQLDALEYKEYDNNGYVVYLFAPYVFNEDKLKNCIKITNDDLMAFYNDYKVILPDSITKWENLIK